MVQGKIRAFYQGMLSEHHRYRSWEHCFGYFRKAKPDGVLASLDTAALQLGFYLASWGMYRGSSFLLQHAYTVHLRAVDRLVALQLLPLWEKEFGAEPADVCLVPTVLAAIQAV